jgi:hypothetical protein
MRFARARSSKQKIWFRLAIVIAFGLVILSLVHSAMFMFHFTSLSPLFGGIYSPEVQVLPNDHGRGTGVGPLSKQDFSHVQAAKRQMRQHLLCQV